MTVIPLTSRFLTTSYTSLSSLSPRSPSTEKENKAIADGGFHWQYPEADSELSIADCLPQKLKNRRVKRHKKAVDIQLPTPKELPTPKPVPLSKRSQFLRICGRKMPFSEYTAYKVRIIAYKKALCQVPKLSTTGSLIRRDGHSFIAIYDLNDRLRIIALPEKTLLARCSNSSCILHVADIAAKTFLSVKIASRQPYYERSCRDYWITRQIRPATRVILLAAAMIDMRSFTFLIFPQMTNLSNWLSEKKNPYDTLTQRIIGCKQLFEEYHKLYTAQLYHKSLAPDCIFLSCCSNEEWNLQIGSLDATKTIGDHWHRMDVLKESAYASAYTLDEDEERIMAALEEGEPAAFERRFIRQNIYALGMIMKALLSGSLFPLSDYLERENFFQKFISLHSVYEELYSLLSHMTTSNPYDRPSWELIYEEACRIFESLAMDETSWT